MKSKLTVLLNKGMFITTSIISLVAITIDFLSDVFFFGYEDLYGKTGIAWYFLIHLVLLTLLIFLISVFIRKTKDKAKGGNVINIEFCIYLIVFGIGKLCVLLNQTNVKCLLLPFIYIDWVLLVIDIVLPILILSIFRKNYKVTKILLLTLAITNIVYLITYLILGVVNSGATALTSVPAVYAYSSIAYLVMMIVSLFLMKLEILKED